ncbi:uncharacterized protein LOC114259593 [Camellia sinensis]|uniref:uncharacterized protein LOC114259593 n=1 Tax=Camellia sinensis TaxID=4442 RepID=UPI00103636C4|nr:uncharacterized protein LOC114259593 [Camellia sinensis]
MPSTIGDTQIAFIERRNIVDGVFITNEVVDGWKKAKQQGLIIKLNFEKAFDSVNWEFLFSLMSNFGFWLNGALNLGILHGFSIGVNEVLLSHLQFADKSILFCEADMDEVVIVKRLLRCFEVLSGFRINYHKSVVCGIGVNDVFLHAFAKLLNCKVQSLPLKFLGLPLGANPGRLTLIKSVLSSLPVYYLSLFKMPKGVAHEIEKIEAAFLWGGVHSLNTFHFFLENCQIKVGDSNLIRFWHDKWCGSAYLKDEFLSLFNLSADKNGSLQQFYARKTNTIVWNFPYRRVLYAWEVAAEARLIITLSSAPHLSLNNADSLVWSSTASGSSVFFVSSLYSLCNSLIGPHLIISNNVSPLCPFCKMAPESASHVLSHCHFSWTIWLSVLYDWGLCWCISQSVTTLFDWWKGGKFKRPLKKFWGAIPLVVL